jgi:hypothetical protein
MRVIFFFISTLVSIAVRSDYYAQGEISGYDYGKMSLLRAFVTPGKVRVDGVRDSDGKVVALNRIFPDSVVEYYSSRNECMVKTKIANDSENLLINGIVAAINTARQSIFVERKPDGSYKDLDVEYLRFSCLKM